MTFKFKILYFVLAVITMVSLAVASVMMAENHGSLATLFFVLSILLIGAGFVFKAKVLKK